MAHKRTKTLGLDPELDPTRGGKSLNLPKIDERKDQNKSSRLKRLKLTRTI